MHSLRLLLDRMPELLVEQRTLSWPGRIAAGDPMDQGQPRRGHRGAARQSGRSIPALSLPHHSELRQSLPEEPQSRRGHCRTEAEDGGAPNLTRLAINELTRSPSAPASQTK